MTTRTSKNQTLTTTLPTTFGITPSISTSENSFIHNNLMRLKVCMRFASVQTLFGDSARNRLLTGVSAVKRAAVVTLGPFGRNVVIEAEKGNHRVTKDGVTVVRSVFLNDRLAEIGAALIRQSSG